MSRKVRFRYPLPTALDPGASLYELKVVLRQIGARRGFACPEDWYELTFADLLTVHGLLDRVKNPIHAARLVHPDLNPLLFACRRTTTLAS